MDGSVQPAGDLRCFEAAYTADAGCAVSAGIYQWPDEREHGAVVWQYACIPTEEQMIRISKQERTDEE